MPTVASRQGYVVQTMTSEAQPQCEDLAETGKLRLRAESHQAPEIMRTRMQRRQKKFEGMTTMIATRDLGFVRELTD